MKKNIFRILIITLSLFVCAAAAGCSVNKKDTTSNEYLYGNTTGNISNLGHAAFQDDWIYYRSNDNNKIYKMKTDGSENQIVD